MGRIGKKLKGKNLNMFGNPIHMPTKDYKEGWDRIFGKKKTESEKSQEELEPIDKETEKFFDDIANNTPNSEQFNDEPKTRLEQMAKLKHDPIVD